MTLEFLFWFLMLLWLIFGIWRNIPVTGDNRFNLGGHILIFIILCVLGLKVFGFPIHS